MSGQCQYCPAKLICPAINKDVQEVASLSPLAITSKEAITLAVARLDKVRLGQILALKARVGWAIDAATAEAKRRLELNLADAPEGFELREGARTREITDPQKAYDALHDAGLIEVEEMIAACKVSLPALEKVAAKRRGVSAKKATDLVADTLGALITYGRKSPSLVESKPALREEGAE